MTQSSQRPQAQQPTIQMAFACESVTGEPGQPVSFGNIMDGISAADFPAPTGRWFAIFCFYSPSEQTIPNCRVIITDGNDQIIAQTVVRDLTFTRDSPVSRNIVRFQGPAWPYPGRYFVRFIANRDDELASFPMWVQHVPTEDANETTSEP